MPFLFCSSLCPLPSLLPLREIFVSELFHLENDPLETHDRAPEQRGVVEELQDTLQDWVEENLAGERTDPIFETRGAWHC